LFDLDGEINDLDNVAERYPAVPQLQSNEDLKEQEEDQ
jgi:hypothetical protein